MTETPSVDRRERATVLGTLDELLRKPTAGLDRAEPGAATVAWAGRVSAGALGCCALYGAASGFFGGGPQIAIAAVKAPVIVTWSALLCVPSLYVFGLLSGASLTRERLVVTISGFVGMLALVLAGLLPIEWLFSVSTRSLAFVVWMHLALWAVALIFGARFLRVALPGMSPAAVRLWLFLFCVVSFQVATFVRPTIVRQPGAPIVESGKMFFLEHFNDALR